MGVIIRQSLKATISSYIGVLIGFVNVIFLFPKFLNPETIGLIETIKAIVMLISPFALFGIPASITKFFPFYLKDGKDDGFYFSLGMIMLGSLFIFSFLFLLFGGNLLEFLGYKAQLMKVFSWLILPAIFSWTVLNYSSIVSHSVLRINVARILDSIFMRLISLAIVLLYGYSFITLNVLVISLSLVFFFPGIILLIYLLKSGVIKVKILPELFKTKNLKEVFKYGGYVVLSMISGLVVQKIDIVMLGIKENLNIVGIYSIAFYIGTVIEIPMRNISDISFPVLSKSFKENDYQQIDRIYKETSINQLVIGGGIFIIIWATIDNVFQVMPNGEVFKLGKYVVFFIGMAKVVDMLMGANKELIQASEFYKLNLYVNITLSVLTVLFNLILIPYYSINGAAVASLLAIIITNIIAFIIVKKNLKMQPFTYKTLITLIIIVAFVFIGIQLPNLNSPILSFVYKGAILSLAYAVIVYFTKVSPMINSFINQAIKKIKP